MYIHFASPTILLAFFLVAFTAHSIGTASKDAVVRPSTEQTGPGGKPLPAKTKRENPTVDFSPARKLLFIWLSVGTILTFVGSAVVVILHAVLARREHWWCGESVAVWHIPGDAVAQEGNVANTELTDLRDRLIFCVYLIPHLACRHQTLPHGSPLLHMDCCSDARVDVIGSISCRL